MLMLLNFRKVTINTLSKLFQRSTCVDALGKDINFNKLIRIIKNSNVSHHDGVLNKILTSLRFTPLLNLKAFETSLLSVNNFIQAIKKTLLTYCSSCEIRISNTIKSIKKAIVCICITITIQYNSLTKLIQKLMLTSAKGYVSFFSETIKSLKKSLIIKVQGFTSRVKDIQYTNKSVIPNYGSTVIFDSNIKNIKLKRIANGMSGIPTYTNVKSNTRLMIIANIIDAFLKYFELLNVWRTKYKSNILIADIVSEVDVNSEVKFNHDTEPSYIDTHTAPAKDMIKTTLLANSLSGGSIIPWIKSITEFNYKAQLSLLNSIKEWVDPVLTGSNLYISHAYLSYVENSALLIDVPIFYDPIQTDTNLYIQTGFIMDGNLVDTEYYIEPVQTETDLYIRQNIYERSE